ncbi:MAG: protein kinase [Polyangiaceae bacterium]|nr:protein kinase [Polyangiaceae bacterium]
MSPPGLDASKVILGKYRVLGVLGRGGMGAVFEVEHTTTLKRCAIKVMLADQDPETRARFIQEARAACTFDHPAIVPVHDVVERRGQVLIVMDLLKGKSLGEMLQHHLELQERQIKHLSVERACKLLFPIVSALGALHEQNFVHRDIKPDNVFVSEGDRTFLLDLGIVKDAAANGQNDGRRLTQSAAGTPLYMAPEQVFGNVDHRVDIWALGMVFYEILTGDAPMMRNTLEDIHRAIIGEEPIRPIRELNPDVPEWLATLIHSMMQRDLKLRPQEMAPIYDALVPHVDRVLVEMYPRPKPPGSVERRSVPTPISTPTPAPVAKAKLALDTGMPEVSRQSATGAMTTSARDRQKAGLPREGRLGMIAVGTAVVAIVGIGGYFGWTKYMAQKTSASSAKPIPAETSSAASPAVSATATAEPSVTVAPTAETAATSASAAVESAAPKSTVPVRTGWRPAGGATSGTSAPTHPTTTAPPPPPATTPTATSTGLWIPFDPTRKKEQ